MENNKELMEIAYSKIKEKKDAVNSDYYRLKYHVLPPVGFLNDPNGFIQINGEYNLFYQFRPFYPNEEGRKLTYWGHLKSKDMVNWEEMPLGLAPGDWYDANGCYSGSAVNNNGVFTLMYTGNVKDKDGNRAAYQCIAETADGVVFKKHANNPVIKSQPEGYTAHFRDPKVWKKDNIWYMVIGTQTVSENGRVLLYRSENLLNWSLVGEVTGSNINGLGDFGYMWECPDLFELGDKDVLVACPQGLEAKGDAYNNIYQSMYFTGKLDYESGSFKHEVYDELDRGFEFYAPQTTLDDKGRRLIIGWMGLPEEENHPTVGYGWLHCMALPRVLELHGTKLYQKPIEELQTLRKNEVSFKNVMVKNQETQIENISGDVFELIVEAELGDSTEFAIKLRCSEDGNEETVISYNKETGKVAVNRDKSGKNLQGIRRCSIGNRSKIKFDIFSDTSSVEVFINDGEEVFSGRIYPDMNSTGIKFHSVGGNTKIESIQKWDLK